MKIRRLLAVTATSLLIAANAEAQSYDWPCSLGIPIPPKGTLISFGPTMWMILNHAVYGPGVVNALANGLGAWNGTNFAGRISQWSTSPTASDCPSGGKRQIGFLSFRDNKATCPALWATSENSIAMFDAYNSWPPGTPCVWPSGSCGTKSILINADIAWSDNGAPNTYDLQSTFAHEFGHMGGAGHAIYNTCLKPGFAVGTCSTVPAKNTMATAIWSQDLCQRTVEIRDQQQMNLIIPTKASEETR